MKKIMLFVACSSLLLSSCDTYTGVVLMLVPHLVLFLVLLLVACLVVLEVQIWVLLSAWLAVLQLVRQLVVRLTRNPSSKENLFIEIDHTLILILIRMEFTSNLYQFIPMTKSLIQLILVMIGFMMKNWGRIMLIHHLWK